jgi:hypothetical protein
VRFSHPWQTAVSQLLRLLLLRRVEEDHPLDLTEGEDERTASADVVILDMEEEGEAEDVSTTAGLPQTYHWASGGGATRCQTETPVLVDGAVEEVTEETGAVEEGGGGSTMTSRA